MGITKEWLEEYIATDGANGEKWVEFDIARRLLACMHRESLLQEALTEYTKVAQRAYDSLKSGWNVHGVAASLERVNIKAHAVLQSTRDSE